MGIKLTISDHLKAFGRDGIEGKAVDRCLCKPVYNLYKRRRRGSEMQRHHIQPGMLTMSKRLSIARVDTVLYFAAQRPTEPARRKLHSIIRTLEQITPLEQAASSKGQEPTSHDCASTTSAPWGDGNGDSWRTCHSRRSEFAHQRASRLPHRPTTNTSDSRRYLKNMPTVP